MGMLKHYLQDESGATAVEYALIAGLITVAIIAGAGAIGSYIFALPGFKGFCWLSWCTQPVSHNISKLQLSLPSDLENML